MVTTYFLNLAMGNLFGTKSSPSIPQEYFLALSSTEPQKNGTGITEPSAAGSAYERVKLESLSQPDNGEITNQETISFPESTSDWGTMLYYGIYDSTSGGNLLMGGPLKSSRKVEANTVVSFKPNGLTITLKDDTTV